MTERETFELLKCTYNLDYHLSSSTVKKYGSADLAIFLGYLTDNSGDSDILQIQEALVSEELGLSVDAIMECTSKLEKLKHISTVRQTKPPFALNIRLNVENIHKFYTTALEDINARS